MSKKRRTARISVDTVPSVRRLVLIAACALGLLAAPLPAAEAARPKCAPAAASAPAWMKARRVTVLADSVLLGGIDALRRSMPCWRMTHHGRRMLFIADAERAVRAFKRVAPLVVVGLGYNSSWELRRKNYDFWAGKFDADANRLVRTLRRKGARQIVWINVRETNRRNTTPDWWWELERYSYFPYVNERLRRLDRRYDYVTLADWNRVSQPKGYTSDPIHLTRRGAALMARTVRAAIFAAARLRARAGASG